MKVKKRQRKDWGEPSDWDGSLTPVKERGGKIEVEGVVKRILPKLMMLEIEIIYSVIIGVCTPEIELYR